MERERDLTKKDKDTGKHPLKLENKCCILRPMEGARKYLFDEKGRYLWPEPEQSARSWIWIAGIVLGIIAILMYRSWPRVLLDITWYLAATVLLVIVGTFILQYLVFLIFWTVGLEVWILPHFLDETYPFLEWVWPPITVQYHGGNWLYRLAVLAGFVALGVYIYSQPTEFDHFVASQRAFVEDLYSGNLLAAAPTDGTEFGAKRRPTLEEILSETEEDAEEAAAKREQAAEQAAEQQVEDLADEAAQQAGDEAGGDDGDDDIMKEMRKESADEWEWRE